MSSEEQGSKCPFSLLSEPISPSSLLFISSSRSIQFNSPYSQLFFFSLLPTFPPYFSLLPTFFGPFLPPPYSVPPPSRLPAIPVFCNGTLWMLKKSVTTGVNNLLTQILWGLPRIHKHLCFGRLRAVYYTFETAYLFMVETWLINIVPIFCASLYHQKSSNTFPSSQKAHCWCANLD